MDLGALLLKVIALLLIARVDSWFWRRRRRRGCHRVNCHWSWRSWSTCSCSGTQTRTMVIHRNPHCHGTACPSTRSETRSCVPSNRRHCRWSYGSWGTCSCSGRQYRSEYVWQYPRCGGDACPSLGTDSRSCVPSSRKHCEMAWRTWGKCSCSGSQSRSTFIKQEPKCGGNSCPALKTETRTCVPGNRKNCIWKWSGWSVCTCGGSTTRSVIVTQQPVCGGVACPSKTKESQSCIPDNIKDCIWSWESWTSCTCDGIRKRERTISQNAECGGIACPKQITQTGNCTWGACVSGSGTCNITDGSCECNAGKTGSRCEKNCPPGTYGLNCQFNCSCDAGSECDPTNGECCPPPSLWCRLLEAVELFHQTCRSRCGRQR